MSEQEEHKQSRAAIAVLGILLFLCFLFAIYNAVAAFVSRSARDFISPYLQVSSKIILAEDYARLMACSKNSLVTAVSALEKENFRLAAENAELRKYMNENSKLRALTKLDKSKQFLPVIAEIIARNSADWDEQFTVSKGSADGVREGDAAVTVIYGRVTVAGRVSSVSQHSSVITTVYSDKNRLSVALSRDNSYGVMKYVSGNRRPVIEYLPLSSEIHEGDTVVTSGLSGNIPAGLIVGKIEKFQDGKLSIIRNNMSIEASVAPVAEINNLRFVAIYTRISEKGQQQ